MAWCCASQGNGLERMNGEESQSLVLSSALNNTAPHPGLALAQFSDEPAELALVPLEPWEAELVDDNDVIGSSECQGIVLGAATGHASTTTTSLAVRPGSACPAAPPLPEDGRFRNVARSLRVPLFPLHDTSVLCAHCRRLQDYFHKERKTCRRSLSANPLAAPSLCVPFRSTRQTEAQKD